VLLLFGNPIFRLWTHGQTVHVPRSLIIATTALFVVRVVGECQSVVLNANAVLVPQIYLLAAHGTLNLLLSLTFVRHYGVVGVAWAFPLSGLLTSLWCYPWLIHRFLRDKKHPGAPAPK
jgi:Na+-driven multidrug efflux pump